MTVVDCISVIISSMGIEQIRHEDSFGHRATTALQEVRFSLLGVFESMDDLSGQRPIDLSRLLGIDMKLAWKASRLVRSVNPAEILNELPGRPGFKKLIIATQKAGASSKSVDRLRAAYETLNSEIVSLSGTRSLFETMITGLGSSVDTPLAVEQRRQFFNGARAVSGSQCDSCYRLDILGPSSKEGFLDCATIRMSVGLVKFHVTAPWRIRLPAVLDDTGTRSRPGRCEPIGSASGESESSSPLVSELCSGPEVNLLPINSAQGICEYSFEDKLIGPGSKRTIAIGEVLRQAEPAVATDSHHGIHQIMRLRTPMESAVMDVLMHRDTFASSGDPRSIIYSDLFGERSVSTYRETDRMPIPVTITNIDDPALAPAPNGMDPEAFSRVREIAFEKTGWSLGDFRYQRIELAFPPVPSSLVYEVAL